METKNIKNRVSDLKRETNETKINVKVKKKYTNIFKCMCQGLVN